MSTRRDQRDEAGGAAARQLAQIHQGGVTFDPQVRRRLSALRIRLGGDGARNAHAHEYGHAYESEHEYEDVPEYVPVPGPATCPHSFTCS